MVERRNLILNPLPHSSGPMVWHANGLASAQIQTDSIRLESDGSESNAFAWTQMTVPAGDWVFSAYLEGSSTGGLISYDQRVLCVTTAETAWRLNGSIAYKQLGARYACAFHLDADGDINLRLYSHSAAGCAVRYRDLLLCSLDDWHALRAMTPPVDYFDGDRVTNRDTVFEQLTPIS
ncbi:hypothetical protein D2E22_1086 [Bifidobacterium castoris]|uniref:Uncharacterized protein n=2 Tax=Bifidobacterium castoris TaxID=2306972 RepID=A0A430F8F0_9BIFI|nr:hypothetical protein D2E22_1086 [Bifidobacterium castoris]